MAKAQEVFTRRMGRLERLAQRVGCVLITRAQWYDYQRLVADRTDVWNERSRLRKAVDALEGFDLGRGAVAIVSSAKDLAWRKTFHVQERDRRSSRRGSRGVAAGVVVQEGGGTPRGGSGRASGGSG